FSEGDRTVTGVPPSVAAVVLDAMGADVIGANCSFGPDKLLGVVKEYSIYTTKPLGVWANAGLPKVVDGKTVFELSPERFVEYIPKFIESGASFIGGCCGTTPAHIAEVAKAVEGLKPGSYGESGRTLLASAGRVVEVPKSGFVVVGERINPSNRKQLTEELIDGKTSIVREEAIKQAEAGADIIDINVGVGDDAEAGAMTAAIAVVEASCDLPVSVDSTDSDILELGVARVTGKPLLNSLTGEKEKLERLIPVAKRYGAAIVALTIDDDGIPDDVNKRVAIAERIIDYALDAGIPVGDIFIDCLMMTAAKGNPEVTFEAVRQVRYTFGVNTILGLSNISHGLPRREGLNAAALLYAVGNGLTTAIINPYDREMRQAAAAAQVFSGDDNGAQKYLKLNVERTDDESGFDKTLQGRFKQAIVEGYRERMNGLIGEAMNGGKPPAIIIAEYLMPGLEEVGDRFQRKEIYLPNVIMAAETVQEAFKVLEPMLEDGEDIDKGTVLFATVKGDVHDIGKNIVSAVLKGYGFKVFDLGKNVETDVILNVAVDSEVDLIALSALMTTTMKEMGVVTEALRTSDISIPVMVGGAVVNEDYADSIGAYYAADATSAAGLAKQIIGKE
ncbi:MAG: dihydropteroate synthase, partial [bacterium]|nr:dihydropteroate synthase [bacterium]